MEKTSLLLLLLMSIGHPLIGMNDNTEEQPDMSQCLESARLSFAGATLMQEEQDKGSQDIHSSIRHLQQMLVGLQAMLEGKETTANFTVLERHGGNDQLDMDGFLHQAMEHLRTAKEMITQQDRVGTPAPNLIPHLQKVLQEILRDLQPAHDNREAEEQFQHYLSPFQHFQQLIQQRRTQDIEQQEQDLRVKRQQIKRLEEHLQHLEQQEHLKQLQERQATMERPPHIMRPPSQVGMPQRPPNHQEIITRFLRWTRTTDLTSNIVVNILQNPQMNYLIYIVQHAQEIARRITTITLQPARLTSQLQLFQTIATLTSLTSLTDFTLIHLPRPNLFLEQITHANPNLTSLTLRWLLNLTDNFLLKSINNSNHLQTLTITNCNKVTHNAFHNLPQSLQTITITNSPSVTPDSLTTIINTQHQRGTLPHLQTVTLNGKTIFPIPPR